MSTVVRGLNDILSGGTEFITFEDGKPKVLLFIDWYEDLVGIREHYEPSLNPKYVRCPGKDVCPLCAANPGKYPALRIKFRVYDPVDNKVKMVSLAKSHIQKLNGDFNLDEVDPTKKYVVIHRSGKGATDTSYSAREYKKGDYELPVVADLDMPDMTNQITAHTPEEIQGFMNALIAGAQAANAGAAAAGYGAAGYGAAQQQAPNGGADAGAAAAAGASQGAGGQRRLPF